MAETQKECDADELRTTGLHGLSERDDNERVRGSWEYKALEEIEAGSRDDQDPILGRRGRELGKNGKPLLLNLGCGFNKFRTHINVDAHEICKPDFVWDLESTPYPWEDNTFDGIDAYHVLEHVNNWWEMFSECARILKPGGYLQIRVPDESNSDALAYRDHVRVFTNASFHGISGYMRGNNAWAVGQENSVPLKMVSHMKVPEARYQWMGKWCPWLLKFCSDHLRNFIWEQRFIFEKVGENG